MLFPVMPRQWHGQGLAQGKGRTGSEAGVLQAEARPWPATHAPSQGPLRKCWLSKSDRLPAPFTLEVKRTL